MQYDAFSYPCLDQLITHVGRYHWRTGGKMEFPLTIRMPYGGGVRAPELHDDSPEAYYVHTPGIKVAIPSTPADAKGLLAAAIRDPDPVVIFEPKLVYRTARGEVPEGDYVVPLGKARIAREGTDVTLIAYGAMVKVCELAADALDVSCEVIDIRSLRPLDEETILASVAKTGRVVIVHEAPRTAGFGAELAALIAEQRDLRPAGPRAAGHRATTCRTRTGRSRTPTALRRPRRPRPSQARFCRDSRLPLERGSLHGHFSRDLPPVLTIDPGDSVAFATPNAGWMLDRTTAVRAALFTGGRRARARGPFEVRGARAGPTLVVRIDEVRPRPWGATFTEPPHRIDWELANGVGPRVDGSGRAARPFLGVIGHAAARPGVTRRSRRGRRAATSTARSSSPARPCTSRSRSTEGCSLPGTGMPRKATAR